jgi:hypothetical protein
VLLLKYGEGLYVNSDTIDLVMIKGDSVRFSLISSDAVFLVEDCCEEQFLEKLQGLDKDGKGFKTLRKGIKEEAAKEAKANAEATK